MALRVGAEKKKRNIPWILGLCVFALLIILVILQSSNIWQILEVDSASDTIFLYALSSLNFVAFVIFAFIFVRSLLKLRQERRALKIGSKIKTRLLLYFFAISLLPIIAMAVFSLLYLNRAVERWFTQIPENVVREVQRQSVEGQEQAFKNAVGLLARSFEKREVSDSELERLVRTGNFVRLEIRSAETKIISYGEQVGISSGKKEALQNTLSLFRESDGEDPSLSDGEGFDVSKMTMSDGRELVAFADMISTENLIVLTTNALEEFDQLKTDQGFLQWIGFSTLGLLTFLLIFAASWFAFYVAKGLTTPIRALAEGAGEITSGNLGYRVDVFAEDELDTLVSAFNEMSSKLEENADELGARRRYIETVLQSLSTGVISFDIDNRVTTLNKAASQMFRLEDADFINLPLEQLVSEENGVVLTRLIKRARRIGHAAEQTTLIHEENDGSAKVDEGIPVAITASALQDDNGVVVVIEDLSELITAQRASAWREVARRMAHEIKNPLTPIQLSAERIAKRFVDENGSNAESVHYTEHDLLEQRETPPDRDREIILEGTDTILREVTSLKSMVNAFSRFAELPQVALEEGNLNDVIRDVATLYYGRETEITLNTTLDNKIPRFLFDPEQLKRVFVNLIDNAIEAFRKDQNDRVVMIETRYDQDNEVAVTTVSDNGAGIASGDYRRLFQPYFSTKGRGTGLGLAIVQRIISEHRAKISAIPNLPRGAKFTVEFPLS